MNKHSFDVLKDIYDKLEAIEQKLSQSPGAESPMLTTKEAAKYLGLTTSTLEAWRVHHRGPAFSKVGRKVLYKRVTLQKFVDDKERKQI